MCHIYKKAVSIVSRIQIPTLFHGTSLHLTELTDDVSLCSYLVEHLSAFYKTIIIVMILVLVILFECVVAIM